MPAQLVASGIPFAEGPVWCPDGTIVATSVAEGALYRIDPAAGTADRIADTGGGANGAALASDKRFLVTQNGGIDFTTTGLYEAPPAFRPVTPGLQLVAADRTVHYLAQDDFQAPNDLAVTDDGRVLFTDPPRYPPPDGARGRVWELARDGSVSLFAHDFAYCNGIACDRDGAAVVVEGAGLQRVARGGAREWVIEDLGPGGGDGFCLDADGRFYVASTVGNCIRVVDVGGGIIEELPVDGGRLTTNCCFGGDDLRTLFVTDGLAGAVFAFEHMPTPGLPLPAWPGFSA
jgi:gluconolactonase